MTGTLPPIEPAFTQSTDKEGDAWASSLNSSLSQKADDIHENTTVDVLHPGLNAGLETPGPDIPGAYPPTPGNVLGSGPFVSSGSSQSADTQAQSKEGSGSGILDKVKGYFPTSPTISKILPTSTTTKEPASYASEAPVGNTERGAVDLPGTASETSIAKLPAETTKETSDSSSKATSSPPTEPSVNATAAPIQGTERGAVDLPGTASETSIAKLPTEKGKDGDAAVTPRTELPPGLPVPAEKAAGVPLPPSTTELLKSSTAEPTEVTLDPPSSGEPSSLDQSATSNSKALPLTPINETLPSGLPPASLIAPSVKKDDASTRVLTDAEGVISKPPSVVEPIPESTPSTLDTDQGKSLKKEPSSASSSAESPSTASQKKRRGSGLFSKIKSGVKKVVHPGGKQDGEK